MNFTQRLEPFSLCALYDMAEAMPGRPRLSLSSVTECWLERHSQEWLYYLMPQQCAEAPDRRDTEGDDEGHAGQAARECVFAPSLEHGQRSNHKEHNRENTESFEPHMQTSARFDRRKKRGYKERHGKGWITARFGDCDGGHGQA
jgi:hypothetical protein